MTPHDCLHTDQCQACADERLLQISTGRFWESVSEYRALLAAAYEERNEWQNRHAEQHDLLLEAETRGEAAEKALATANERRKWECDRANAQADRAEAAEASLKEAVRGLCEIRDWLKDEFDNSDGDRKNMASLGLSMLQVGAAHVSLSGPRVLPQIILHNQKKEL